MSVLYQIFQFLSSDFEADLLKTAFPLAEVVIVVSAVVAILPVGIKHEIVVLVEICVFPPTIKDVS